MSPFSADQCFNIGVTGHRLNRISQLQLDRLTPQVRPLLAQIARAAGARITLISGLAEGADRHLAQLALAQGFALHAVLPFAREVYRRDFATVASRRQFDALLARAEHIAELPGQRAINGDAYRLAGHALMEQAHLLLAVWDGKPSQGAGGTAEIVGEACRRHIPVIHLSVNPPAPAQLIWQRHGRCAADATTHAKPCSTTQVASVIAQLRSRRKS